MTAAGQAAGVKRAAVLVIHGIGEQSPYETLDAFAAGLALEYDVPRGALRHILEWGKDGPVTAVRVPLATPLGRSGARELDVHELYWASLVQGKISFRQVLAWVVGASLIPLLTWSQQPALLLPRGTGQQWRARRRVFLRHLLIALGLAGVGLGLLSLFLYAAVGWRTLVDAARGVWAAVAAGPSPVALVWWLTVALCAATILKGGLDILLARVRQTTIERQASLWWALSSLVAAAALGGVAWWIDWKWGAEPVTAGRQIWAAVAHGPVAAAAAAVLAATALRWVFLKFVGDIALYVNADERSEFYRTREAILDKTIDKLRWLLEDARGYSAVYLVGHSLGSVIAYDVINRLVREVRAEPRKRERAIQFDRLLGLLTLGSPLDKVYYFFRTEVKPTQAIRAQILSSLHAFARVSSGRQYGNLQFATYEVPRPADFRWVNVWSATDPVSGFLDFYDVTEQPHLGFAKKFLTAHVAYWKDRRFYKLVREWL